MFWYLIVFKWQNLAWSYKTTKEVKGHLQVTSASGTHITIPRLEPWEAQQTLGVWLAPDGNNDAEVQYLSQVTAEWHTKMATAQIS